MTVSPPDDSMRAPHPDPRAGIRLDLADRCVKCGLCLPHCPTYRQTADEGDSPRGRIALMQGLATGELAQSARLEAHLDGCLGCRACESVCPSDVPYGQLIDAGWAALEPGRRRTPMARLARRAALQWLIPHPARLRTLGRLARGAQRTGLRVLARRSGILRMLRLTRADALLPSLRPAPRLQRYYPPAGTERGRVALFTGCVAPLAEPRVATAAIAVLTRLGFGVHVPRTQTCCGALHQHNGDPATAAALAARNVRVFADVDCEAIVSTASGCAAQLAEYGRMGDTAAFAARVHEIGDFLAALDWPADAAPAPLPARAALHVPCTLRHVLRRPHGAARVLERIPGLEVRMLDAPSRCCGAGGSHVLTHPAMADALRDEHLDALTEPAPDYLLTSNTGCALHLAAGLRARGLDVETLHPVELLARQLATGAPPVAGDAETR